MSKNGEIVQRSPRTCSKSNPSTAQSSTFYYVGATGISIRSSRLQIPASALQIDPVCGDGGVILDSANHNYFLEKWGLQPNLSSDSSTLSRYQRHDLAISHFCIYLGEFCRGAYFLIGEFLFWWYEHQFVDPVFNVLCVWQALRAKFGILDNYKEVDGSQYMVWIFATTSHASLLNRTILLFRPWCAYDERRSYSSGV